MVIFAFTLLSLALFAVSGVFAYRYAKREFQITLKAHIARFHKRARVQDKAISKLMTDFEHLATTIKQIPGNKNLVLSSANVKDNMEERYARQNPTVVAVDNVQKVI